MATHWNEVYRLSGGIHDSWYVPAHRQSLDLLWTAGVAQRSAVLDVGGGAGTFVDGMLQAGFRDVSVLDVSTAALEIARTRVGERGESVCWITHDLLAWTPRRHYDVWHDRALLHFLLDEQDRARYLRVLRRSLADDGYAVLATFAPDGPQSCSGLPVRRYSATDLAEFLGEDFQLLDQAAEVHLTPSGHEQSFTWVLLRRAA